MVRHLGPHRFIDFFFANYKSANTKKIRSFKTPLTSQTLLLVKAFYRANLIYSFSIDEFKNSIIIYPRFASRFKNFQVVYSAHSLLQSNVQLRRYQNLGYNFILFTPFHKIKFITITEFSIYNPSGILLALW